MQVVVCVHNGQVYKKQDVVGLGDPYVELKVGDVQRNTSVQKNTLDPVWEQGIVFREFF
jgi:Ca2+-dependent lipid-binding protein